MATVADRKELQDQDMAAFAHIRPLVSKSYYQCLH